MCGRRDLFLRYSESGVQLLAPGPRLLGDFGDLRDLRQWRERKSAAVDRRIVYRNDDFEVVAR